MVTKKLLLFSFLLYGNNIFCAQSIYVGSLQFPLKIEALPTLPSILYKGREYTIDVDKQDTRLPRRASYELYEDRWCSEFYILITEYLKIPNANDFAHLETSAQHEYVLYQVRRMVTEKALLKTAVDEQQTGTEVPPVPGEKIEYWEIKKINTTGEEIIIPDNTLIFFMNPSFVELVSETWRPDDVIIKLPTIKFKDSVDEKTLHDMGAKMVCAILDFKCLHKKPTKTITAFANSRSIAIPNPLNRYVLNS